jgi:DNA-dependent RNA polymerase auxiliary subunit epsilon
VYNECLKQLLIHDAKREPEVPKEDTQVLYLRLAIKADVRHVLQEVAL